MSNIYKYQEFLIANLDDIEVKKDKLKEVKNNKDTISQFFDDYFNPENDNDADTIVDALLALIDFNQIWDIKIDEFEDILNQKFNDTKVGDNIKKIELINKKAIYKRIKADKPTDALPDFRMMINPQQLEIPIGHRIATISRIYGFLGLADIFRLVNQTTEAKENLDSAFRLINTQDEGSQDPFLAAAHERAGLIFASKRQIQEAIQSYQRCLTFYQNTGNVLKEIFSYRLLFFCLGNKSNDPQHLSQAINYYETFDQLTEALDFKSEIGRGAGDIFMPFIKTNRLDEAKDVLEKSDRIAMDRNDNRLIAQNKIRYTRLYLEQGDYSNAISKILELNNLSGDENNQPFYKLCTTFDYNALNFQNIYRELIENYHDSQIDELKTLMENLQSLNMVS